MEKIFEIPRYAYRRSADQRSEDVAEHPVVIVGAGPIGLAAAIDFALQDIPVVLLDENDRVSRGSRAVCYAKRPLEILGRLGCGEQVSEHGVGWNIGKVFKDERQVYEFDLLPEEGHKYPAFVNLQQYYLENYLVNRIFELQDEGKKIEFRGRNQVTKIDAKSDHVMVDTDTPDGPYSIKAEWLIAADGASSPIRGMMGLDFLGRTFRDHFLICDVIMKTTIPAERWFWFDPPFNRGQSVLLHKQANNIWRVDFQLGFDTDKDEEAKPENVIPRLRAMLGDDAEFELEWVSVYTFNCRQLSKFRHGRVLFVGDAAHQVSPFGARGANSGLEDADNLVWKLKLVLEGKAPESLMDSFSAERVYAAKENLMNSTRSTDFITPKSEVSTDFRDAVLSLAAKQEFAKPLVNSGRLATPCTYDDSLLNGPDVSGMPARTRPGSCAADMSIPNGWLIENIGGSFCLLAINTDAPDQLTASGLEIKMISLSTKYIPELKERYLGDADSGVYLLRPDQYVAARWDEYDEKAVIAALNAAIGRG